MLPSVDGQDRVVLGGFSGNTQLLFTGAQSFLCLAQGRDIDKSQHHAVDVVVAGAVRAYLRKVMPAVGAGDRPLDQFEGFEYLHRVVCQQRIVEPVGNVQQGAVDV